MRAGVPYTKPAWFDYLFWTDAQSVFKPLPTVHHYQPFTIISDSPLVTICWKRIAGAWGCEQLRPEAKQLGATQNLVEF